MRIIVALALALTLASSAHAADVDWKMYGGASIAGPSVCFYDANSVARASSGYVRVWTKCFASKDLAAMTDDVGLKVFDNAARKIKDGYVPPIIVIGKMDFQQIPEIVAYEQIADLGSSSRGHIFFSN